MEQRLSELEKAHAKMEQRMDQMEKDQERQDKEIRVLDDRTDEMGKFAVRIDLIVESLDKTTKNIEKTLNDYISKQEAKEEESRKAVAQSKDQEISKWKTISIDLLKYLLLALGIGTAGQGLFETIKNFIK